MFVLMVPNEIKDASLSVFPSIGDIKIAKLLTYDESLSDLLKRSKRLFLDLLSFSEHILANEDGVIVDCSSKPIEFIWDSKEYQPQSLDGLIDLFNVNLSIFTDDFEKIKEKINEKSADNSFESQSTQTSQHQNQTEDILILPDKLANLELSENSCTLEYPISYLDCIYCMIGKSEEKSFKKIVNKSSLEVLREDPRNVLYKIYCLKTDSNRLLDILSRSYKCSRSVIPDEANNLTKSRCQDVIADLHSLAENSTRKLLIHIFLLKAYIEALHSIGLPQNYKFKIVDKIKKEMKRIAKDNCEFLVAKSSDFIPYVSVEIDKEILRNLSKKIRK